MVEGFNVKSEGNNKRIIILFIISFMAILYTCVIHKKPVEPAVQQGIAKEVIRFHVIANSDTEIDQDVKMKVKDNVVEYLQGKLKHAKTKKEAKKIICKESKKLRKIAQKTIEKEGFQYDCKVVYGKRTFPVKMYGDLTFPEGEYDALQIVLGKAEGHNWWCVMFPTLCFLDGTYMIVPDVSKQLLKNTLTKEEYSAISEPGHFNIRYRLKIGDWWKKFSEKAVKIVE